ncbi:MAG: hypothetical protein KatS3mg064_2827 [Tepidiforma sp.]|nr:phage tail tube protein [Tepidiforma sp.]GIW19670.1 MAG: hypothetical protein KatS3mg064_2827 [Tepidiforma sp.]
MPTALASLNRLQLGKETAAGTAVAATAVIPGAAEFEETIEFYRSDYPRGVRVAAGGAGVITGRGTTLKVETELTAEEVLWPLLTGIASVTPTGTGPAYTWTFAPALSGHASIATATAEFVRTDGATNHYVAIAPYCICTTFGIEWSASEVARLSWEMTGRARQAGAPTASLTPYASREPLVGGLGKVFVDGSWGALGTTQLLGTVRSGSLEVTTGLVHTRTVDGRADLDATEHTSGMLEAKLDLVVELDAAGAARYAQYRQNELAFVRLRFEGTAIGGQPRYVQADGCWRVAGAPKWQADGQQVLLGLSLELVQDPATGNAIRFEARNGLGAV